MASAEQKQAEAEGFRCIWSGQINYFGTSILIDGGGELVIIQDTNRTRPSEFSDPDNVRLTPEVLAIIFKEVHSCVVN